MMTERLLKEQEEEEGMTSSEERVLQKGPFDIEENLNHAREIVQKVNEMQDKFKREKRDLVSSHIEAIDILNEALDIYARALEKMSEQYGEGAYQCIPVAIDYANTLLMKAKMENSIAMFHKVSEILESKALDQFENNDSYASAFNTFAGTSIHRATASSSSSSKRIFVFDHEEKDEVKQQQANPREQIDDNDNDEEEEEAGEGNDDGEEEEDSMHDAWIIFEMARNTLMNELSRVRSEEEKKPISNLLAQVHTGTGEIHMENDSFPEAVSEFRRALDLTEENNLIQKASLYLKIATALLFQRQPINDIMSCYADAESILKQIIDNSQNIATQELQQARDMLDEVKNRTQELKDSEAEKRELEEKERMEKEKKTLQNSNRPVRVLSVKRKRPEIENSGIDESKKAKSE
jgi:ElaB/YqjD/DUF883 family membrane-anchored ribosome-binding protein